MDTPSIESWTSQRRDFDSGAEFGPPPLKREGDQPRHPVLWEWRRLHNILHDQYNSDSPVHHDYDIIICSEQHYNNYPLNAKYGPAVHSHP